MQGCDHETVCRFASPNDNSYKSIVYEIQDVLEQLHGQ